jgi:hypothetical protein
MGIVPTWHAEYPRMPAHGVGFRGRMQPGRPVSDHPYDTDSGAAGPMVCVVHSQCRPRHTLCGVPGDVSPSVHVCADWAADVIGGRWRRMDLRPYGIGDNGGYLAVAGHPRPPAGAKQTRSRLLGYVWRSAGGTPPRSTGTRPPLGAGAAVDPGRFTPFLPGPAGIPPCRISTTTDNQWTGESPGEHPPQGLVGR